jgi:four helix bundle protein
MAKTGFEKLEVYRLAEEIADDIWRVVLGWTPFARATVGQQAVRAADSIGANIAEVTGARQQRTAVGSFGLLAGL